MLLPADQTDNSPNLSMRRHSLRHNCKTAIREEKHGISPCLLRCAAVHVLLNIRR
jgi:hypothetical protein